MAEEEPKVRRVRFPFRVRHLSRAGKRLGRSMLGAQSCSCSASGATTRTVGDQRRPATATAAATTKAASASRRRSSARGRVGGGGGVASAASRGDGGAGGGGGGNPPPHHHHHQQQEAAGARPGKAKQQQQRQQPRPPWPWTWLLKPDNPAAPPPARVSSSPQRAGWLASAPRVRVRGAGQRAASEILELAAVNERLAGDLEPWEVRRRLEHLRARVEDWEAVYSLATRRDAAATLAGVEEAAAAADALLGASRAAAAAEAAAGAAGLGFASHGDGGERAGEDGRDEEAEGAPGAAPGSGSADKTGVAELRLQLLQLRAQVDEAAQRLGATQARVDENLRRVGELRAEAARLEALRASDARAAADVARERAGMVSAAAAAAEAAAMAAAAAATTGAAPSSASASSPSQSSPSPLSSPAASASSGGGPAAAVARSAAADAAAAEAAARDAERAQAAVDRAADLGAGAGAFAPAAAAVAAAPRKQQQQQQHPRPQRAAAAAAAPASTASPAGARGRGLASSLDLERGLRNFWYAAAFSTRLDAPGTLVPFELFGEPWVLFRDAAGAASCLRDECAHRACPLSLGKVDPATGSVSCAYHGWKFAGDGACVEMPSTTFCRGVRVRSLPVAEANGFVWVWPGDGPAPVAGDGRAEWQSVAAAALPEPSSPGGPAYLVHAEIEIEVPVEHGLLMENLLDLAHAPFTHTGTFAKGWPVPEAVRFHATRALAGAWDPYPIDMAFAPPCVAVSVIGLAQPGKIQRGARAGECARHLHQVHVCLPAGKGRTRLLYRMALDFMPWARGLPGADALWRRVAGQVLGEDLALVSGQQARMMGGGDTWQNPVSYDKLAVRYRRWRNAAAAQGATAAGAAGLLPGSRRAAERLSAPVTMSAGELFTSDEEEEETGGGGEEEEWGQEGGRRAAAATTAAEDAAADDEASYVDAPPPAEALGLRARWR